MPPRKRLGALLIEMAAIDEHQLDSALGQQKKWGGRLGEILVTQKMCSEADVLRALSTQFNLPVVQLADISVEPRVLKLVSRQFAEKLRAFPLELTGAGRAEILTVAMSAPTDLSVLDQVAFHVSRRLKPVLAADSDIEAAIERFYGAGASSAAARPPSSASIAVSANVRAGVSYTPAPSAPAPAAVLPSTDLAGLAEPVDPNVPPRARFAEIDPALGADDGSLAQMPGLEPIAAHSNPDIAQGEAVPVSNAPAPLAFDGSLPAEPAVNWDDAPSGESPVDWDAAPSVLDVASAAEPSAAWDMIAPEPEQSAPASQAEGENPFGAARDWSNEPSLAANDLPAANVDEIAAAELLPEDEDPLPELVVDLGDELPADAILGTADGVESLDAAAAEPSLFELAIADVSVAESVVEELSAEAPAAWGEVADPLAHHGHGVQSSDAHELITPAVEEAAAPGESEGVPSFVEESIAPTLAEESTTPEAYALAEDSAPVASGEPIEAGDPATSGLALLEAAPAESIHEEQAVTETVVARDDAEEMSLVETTDIEFGDDEFEPDEEAQLSREESAPVPPLVGWVEEPTDLPPEPAWLSEPPAPRAEEQHWIGQEYAETTPLSPFDVETLAGVGVDPSDGLGAQRLLAALLRALAARKLIDLGELTVDLYAQRLDGAAHGASAHEQTEPAASELLADEPPMHE